ncbi:MAG: iron-sulfur cluster assembly protein [Caulobacteraceae bacterium]
MFIQTEATADPARLTFLPGREVLAGSPLDFRSTAEAAVSPLAEQLLAIPGVTGVRFGADSITVAKDAGDWAHLKPPILAAIMDHFVSGAPLLHGTPVGAPPPEGSAADEPLDRIAEALRQVIDPELGYNIVDLGLVYDVTIDGGAVRVVMTTTTPGCPATGYLTQGAGESVSALPQVERVEVELSYNPRWSTDMMSAEAKAHFGIE